MEQQPQTPSPVAEDVSFALSELRRVVLQADATFAAIARAPVVLDAAMRARFIAWSRERNTRKWVNAQARMLSWWEAALGGRDLRTVSLRDHVEPALEHAPARAHRIAVLKRLYTWLCNVRHDLAEHEDPTRSLKVPQSSPAQWRRSKVVAGDELAARRHLGRRYRDGVDVLLGTGWHTTELERFARSGEIHEPTVFERRRGVAGVLETRHKNGGPSRTCVTAAVLAAARRVRARGGISISRLAKMIRVACDVAGVERWSPGRLRHTVATFALQRETPDRVAAFLHHRDKRTTLRFYAVYVAPQKVPTPL